MAQIINVNYGHVGHGKLYAYRDKTAHRIGDEVKVPVTNPNTGKTYMTLAVVRSTHGENSAGTRDTLDYLGNRGIALKTVAGGSLRELPGFKRMQAKYGNGYDLQEWRRDAELENKLLNEYRLLPNMSAANFAKIARDIRGLTRK